MPNLKEINPQEGCLFGWLKVTCIKQCKKEEKGEEKGTIFRNTYLAHYWVNFFQKLVCRVAYMEGIKYVNLIEIGTVVIEIQEVENGKLAVPVNNTLVRHTAFLATDTRLCILMLLKTVIPLII